MCVCVCCVCVCIALTYSRKRDDDAVKAALSSHTGARSLPKRPFTKGPDTHVSVGGESNSSNPGTVTS